MRLFFAFGAVTPRTRHYLINTPFDSQSVIDGGSTMKSLIKLALATSAFAVASFVTYGPSDAGIGIPPTMAQNANVGINPGGPSDAGIGIPPTMAQSATNGANSGDAAVINGQASPTPPKPIDQNNDANGGLNASNGQTGQLPNGQPLKSGTPPGVGGNIDK
jgi:hypothetical protein